MNSHGSQHEHRSLSSRLSQWVRTRFAIKQIEENVIYHRVTKEPWYQGDGAALFLLFFVLIATGSVLALTYSPSPLTAYQSVVRITKVDTLGWYLRAVHYWAAGLMVLTLLFHVFRHALLGGYLAPREGIWLIGVVLFFLVLTNAFTGYTLRWDERAIYAIQVVLNMFYHVPVIGDELVRLVQGGWTLGAATLSRFYAVHVLFVPLSLLALAAYHMYLVIIYGVTTQAERQLYIESAEEQIALHERLKTDEKYGHEFYPYTVVKSGGFAMAVFAIVVLLALAFGPQELYPEANLVETSVPVEEWWFHWYSALIAYVPPAIAPFFYVAFPIGLFLIMVALPFVDRMPNRGLRRRPLAVTVVSLLLIGLLGLTGLRLRSPWTAWPRTEPPPVPANVQLTDSAARGRVLFTQHGCFNCHAIGGQGSGFGPNLTGLDARLSPSELRQYILQPPAGVPMPAYRDRITANDLERIVGFVLVAQTFPKKF